MRRNRQPRSSLNGAVHELGATAGTAMVPLEDGRTLANVVAGGGPLAVFTVADCHPVDDERYTGSVAYRTGRQCVRVRSETPSGVRPAMPFPYAIVATPLVSHAERSFGVLVLIWADPVDRTGVSARVRNRCETLAQELSRRLQRQGGLSPRRRDPRGRDSSWPDPRNRKLCSSRRVCPSFTGSAGSPRGLARLRALRTSSKRRSHIRPARVLPQPPTDSHTVESPTAPAGASQLFRRLPASRWKTVRITRPPSALRPPTQTRFSRSAHSPSWLQRHRRQVRCRQWRAVVPLHLPEPGSLHPVLTGLYDLFLRPPDPVPEHSESRALQRRSAAFRTADG